MAQTHVSVKWGMFDHFGLPEYSGLQYAATSALSLANATTFVNVLAGCSEAGLKRVETSQIDTTEIAPSGDNASSYVASIIFKESDGDYKCPITIPAIKESLLQRDGRVLTVAPATVTTIKNALETLTGKTFLSNPKVMVYTRR